MALEDRVDGADRDLCTQELTAQASHLAAGEPEARSQRGDGPLQARSEALSRHLGRQLTLGERTPAWTATTGQPVLGDVDRDLRQLGDLVGTNRPPRRSPDKQMPTLDTARADTRPPHRADRSATAPDPTPGNRAQHRDSDQSAFLLADAYQHQDQQTAEAKSYPSRGASPELPLPNARPAPQDTPPRWPTPATP